MYRRFNKYLKYPPTLPFDDEMLYKLLKTIISSNHQYKERDFLIVYLCATLGLRISECLRINLRDIYLDKRILVIPAENTKTKRPRIVYLHTNLPDLLRDYIRKYKDKFIDGYIFFSRRKKSSTPYLQPRGFRDIFMKYKKEAGIYHVAFITQNNQPYTHYRIHDLRAYFCIKVMDSNPNKSLTRIAYVTGHSSEFSLKTFYLDKGIFQLKEQRECMTKAFNTFNQKFLAEL